MKPLFKPVFYSVCGLPKLKFFILLSEAMLIEFFFFQQNIQDTVKSYHSSSTVLLAMNGSYGLPFFRVSLVLFKVQGHSVTLLIA